MAFLTPRAWCGLLCAVVLIGCGEGRTVDSVLQPAEGIVVGPPSDLEAPIQGAPAGSTVWMGMVEPSRFAELRFDVPGEVAEVHVQVGDSVKQGQVLATLSTEEREQKLAETRQLYRQAQRALPAKRRSDGGAPDYVRREAKARLGRKRQQARDAQRDKRIIQAAAARGGEQAAVAEATRLALERNERPRSSTMRRANRERYSARAASDLKARVSNLEYALRASELKSPFDGVVVAVNLRSGAPWATRDPDPAISMFDPTRMVVRLPVRDDAAGHTEPKAPAWVELIGPEGAILATVPGRVAAVGEETFKMTNDEGVEEDWRDITVQLPSKMPVMPGIGDEARVALLPS